MSRTHRSPCDRPAGSGMPPRGGREKLQRCSRCRSHGYVTSYKGRRDHSKNCSKCILVEERRRPSAAPGKAQREEGERAVLPQSAAGSLRETRRGHSKGSGSSYAVAESRGAQESAAVAAGDAARSSIMVQPNPTYSHWSNLEPTPDLDVDFMSQGNFSQPTQDQYAVAYCQVASHSRFSQDPPYYYQDIYQDVYHDIYSGTPYRMSSASEPTSSRYPDSMVDNTLWGASAISDQFLFENQPQATGDVSENLASSGNVTPTGCPANEERGAPRRSSLQRIFTYDEYAFIDALLSSPYDSRLSPSGSDSDLGEVLCLEEGVTETQKAW